MKLKMLLASLSAVLVLIGCSGENTAPNASESASSTVLRPADGSSKESVSSQESSEVSSEESSDTAADTSYIMSRRVGDDIVGTVELPMTFVFSPEQSEDNLKVYSFTATGQHVMLASYTQEEFPQSTAELAALIESSFKEHELYVNSSVKEATVANYPGYNISVEFSDDTQLEAFIFQHENGKHYHISIEGSPSAVASSVDDVLSSWQVGE